mgnify:CR=1 FL=1
MVDKNQAMVDFLLNCPTIKDNPLFFNFGSIQDNNNQLVINANDVELRKPYIDGSVLKCYTFSVVSYKSVAYNPVVDGLTDENLADYATVQSILNWIAEQADEMIFPDFGEECVIDSMEPLTENPALNGVDTSLNPPMAKYSIGIKLQYIDNSKKIWK